MKTYLKKVILALLILASLAILFVFIKFKLFDNTITISGNDIDLGKIVIKSIEENKIIYKNNKMISEIKNQYGGDNFNVYYDDELIGQAGIEKTSWWHTHNYYFTFFKRNTEIIFEFNAKGSEGRTSYYKHHKMDPIINKSIETFYNSEGKTGQINIEYYNKKGKVISDEVWINDTLVNMNMYLDGNWYKNYCAYKYSDDTTYSLLKIIRADSLIYIYQTNVGNIITSERIAIKTNSSI